MKESTSDLPPDNPICSTMIATGADKAHVNSTKPGQSARNRYGTMKENIPSIEIKQVLRAVTHLNLIRMHLTMYPPGHIRIKESLDEAYDIIQDILRITPEVTIGVAGEVLMVGETILDKKNSILRNYARSLNKLLILALRLNKGVKKADLLEFSRLLASNPADVLSSGPIEAVLIKHNITGIMVKGIDSDVFNITDNREFSRTSARKQEKAEDFWQELIALAEFRATGYAGQGTAGRGNRAPAAAMEHLSKPQHWQSAAREYESMLQDYFREIPSGEQRQSETSEKYGAISRINNLLQELHPTFKEQLIAAAGRQISLQPESVLVHNNLHCFPREMILEMVQRENERKGRMSPSLVVLLNKLAGGENKIQGGEYAPGDAMSAEVVGSLLRSEQYEMYVPEDYEKMLQKAADTSSLDSSKENPFIRDCLKTMTDEHIVLQISQFLLGAMDEELIEETYLNYSQKLELYVPELFRAGHFSFLADAIDTLRCQGQEKHSPGSRQAAMSLLNIISNSETIARHLTPFLAEGAVDHNTLVKFLTASGVQNVSWLFDTYLDLPSHLSEAFIDILKRFERAAYDEACKRLAELRPESIIRLLSFFRSLGDRSILPALKDIFGQEDFHVKKEVIETLMHFEERSSAEALLREKLRSPNRQEVLYAVALICHYGFMELLENMMSLVKTFRIREEDAVLNEFIVNGLVAAKDPAVVPYLQRIAGKRLSLSPKRLARMRRIVDNNLSNFK